MSRPAEYCHLGVNWFTGCRMIHSCAQFCWAQRFAERMRGRFGYPADDPFRPTFHEEVFQRPLPTKPRVICLNFMGDWAYATKEQKRRMLGRVGLYPQHVFLALTKEPDAFAYDSWDFPPNLWFGVSASTTFDLSYRLRVLRRLAVRGKWLSLEPILEPLDAASVCNAFEACGNLRWVVVGCQSGPKAKETWGGNSPFGSGWAIYDWTEQVIGICKDYAIPVWVKQLPTQKKGGPPRVSHNPADWPEELRVQERPYTLRRVFEEGTR